jgi:hypothetical protein
MKKPCSILLALGILISASLFTSCQKECVSEHYGYLELNNKTSRTIYVNVSGNLYTVASGDTKLEKYESATYDIYAESADGLFYWGPFNETVQDCETEPVDFDL